MSLYVTLRRGHARGAPGTETKLERVPIAGQPAPRPSSTTVITEATLTGAAPADYGFAPELAFAFRLAKHLKAGREVVRGKPETFNRPDYNFRLDGNDGAEPKGHERVLHQRPRMRGSPLDLIVAEAMILANSTWGGWLAENGVPGIYRSQASMAPGIKVRMGTKPAPHAGMGVAQYTWATSPLRRYVDLVNQWQIIACARHGQHGRAGRTVQAEGRAAVLDHLGFDAAYTAYNGFQSGIERFWTLQLPEQQGLTELDARPCMKDGLVRADDAAAGVQGPRRRTPAAQRARARAHHRHRPADARSCRPAC